MDRELYYIPEEEMEATVASQVSRSNAGVIQIIVSFVLAILFVCTDVDHYDIPWTMLIVAIGLFLNGVRLLIKVDQINRKYDLHT